MKKLITLVALLLIMGCTNDDSNNNQTESEISEKVVVVLDDVSNVISNDFELSNGTYRIEFTEDVPVVNEDDIIVGDEGEGFLRKVTSVNRDNNILVMQTSQATLDDLFDDASFQFNTDISQSFGSLKPEEREVKINYQKEGVSMAADGLSFDFSNTVLYESGTLDITITNGNVSFNPNLIFNSDYSLLRGLEFLEFKVENADLVLNCELDIRAVSSINLPEFSQTLINYDRPLVFPVNGIPVVVIVNTELVAVLNAGIENEINATPNWSSSFGVSAGVKYENNSWSNEFNLNSSLSLDNINLNGQANVSQSLEIIPKISLKFYGIIGPYCQPGISEDFSFNLAVPSLDWDANLDCGLDIVTGINVNIFGKDLIDYNFNNNFEESIWNSPENVIIESGNNQTGIPEEPLDEPLKVKVTDALNNPVPLVPVYFSVSENNGSLDQEIVITDNEGFAEVNWTLGDSLEPQTVEVTVKKANGNNIESIVVFNANSEGNDCDNSFTDPRDGQTYCIVQIGSQTWFAENLRYVGDIPQIIGDDNWAAIWNDGNQIEQPAWCYYDDNSSYDDIYGKLYNWYAVNTGTLCPPGWHIPSDAEWWILTDYLGGLNEAGGKMKSISGWNPPNAGATNSSGFTALPSGARREAGTSQHIGENSIWWSSSDYNVMGAWGRDLTYLAANATRFGNNKMTGYACRCIMD
ncbi:MAG: hypothetical protein KTR22_05255 [Flavobacteriaceae bacterium]|nr:hypothetical protein [Flavobacteriaceae bacterium]